VLAGVGGRTVADAKRSMSSDEFQAWMAYREMHGPLALHRRMEHGFAMVAQTVASTIPRKRGTRGPKLEDFLPQRAARLDKPIELAEAMKRWR